MGLRLQGLMFPWRLPCLRILQHLHLQRFVASESVARCSSKAMSMEAVQRRDPEEEEDEKLGVLIVGAGPVGLTLSILLSSYGVRSLVVERRSKLSDHPQAHFLNNRTMEIFRKMEGLSEEIETKQPPLEHWRRFVYCTTLAGRVLGTVDHLQPEDVPSGRSPTSVAHFSQHHLLPLLFERAQRLGHRLEPKASTVKIASSVLNAGPILMGHECTSIKSSSNGVLASIFPTQAGIGQGQKLACQYLVAADGAGSSVRELAGVQMEGDENLQKLISVHFMSKQLGQHLLDSVPGMLYFVFNQRVIAVIVAHNLEAGEFIAQIPFYPPQQQFEEFTEEVCKGIIYDAAGTRDIEIEIKTIKKWSMHAQVAASYFDKYGRIILVGDAAHRFPPAGGFGLNTGVQDAHNLAWKLAAVLKGHCPSALLLTYDTERRPVAIANTALSVANFKAAMAVPAALGLDPSAARLVHKVVNSGVGLLLPERFQVTLLDGLFAIGRAQVSPAFLSSLNPIGSARVLEVQRILREGQSLQLQFPAEDLGFRYLDGALVPEVGAQQQTNSHQNFPTGRRREYLPSTQPGARLPHFPIHMFCLNPPATSKEICSTLDLVSRGGNRMEFVLLVQSHRSGCCWGDAAITAGQAFGIWVKVVFIWPSGSYDRFLGKSHIHTESAELGNDQMSPDKDMFSNDNEATAVFEWSQRNEGCALHAEEVGCGWQDIFGIPETGAILVRPDDHIAWRSKAEPKASSTQELYLAFSKVLKKPNIQVPGFMQ